MVLRENQGNTMYVLLMKSILTVKGKYRGITYFTPDGVLKDYG